MKRSQHQRWLGSTRRAQRGVSMVELAFVLPVLLLLGLGVFDFARAIHYHNVLVSLSREGANLAARSTATPQQIMAALASTAQPLSMNAEGMMIITKIVGRADGSAVVDAQYRLTGGDHGLSSRVWSCSGWGGDGTCNVPASRPVIAPPLTIRDGETVYAVEAMYDYIPVIDYVFRNPAALYTRTVL